MSQGLFTAVSGIRVNQTRLAVISNNLANVNTVAFKGSSVNFKTVFADTLTQGTAPTSTSGGVNPMQVGNGVSVSNISVNHNQGGSISTNNDTDFLINGSGYFTIEKFNSDGTPGFSLTRAGNFSMDADGNLVSASGNAILGTATISGNDPTRVAPINIPRSLTITKTFDSEGLITSATIESGEVNAVTDDGSVTGDTKEYDVQLTKFNVGSDGSITAFYSNGDILTVTNNTDGTMRQLLLKSGMSNVTESGDLPASGTVTMNDTLGNGFNLLPEHLQVRLANVTNPDGLTYAGNNNWEVSANSGDIQFGIGNNGSRGAIEAGALESSNVDIAMEFTNMIVAQRGLEAASKAVSVQSDVLRTIIGIV